MRFLDACRKHVLLDFSKYLGICKEFLKLQGVFFKFYQVLFYKKSGTFNEVVLSWSSLTSDIFSKNNCFLRSDKCQIQKSSDVIARSFCPSKNPRNSEEAIERCSGKKGSLIVLAKSFERLVMKFIFYKLAASWNYIIVNTSKAWQAPHLQQGESCNIAKKLKKVGPWTF